MATWPAFPTSGTENFETNARAALETWRSNSEAMDTKLTGIEDAADVTDADNVGAAIHGATTKSPPAGADEIALIDTAGADALKKTTCDDLLAARMPAVTHAASAKSAAALTDEMMLADSESSYVIKKVSVSGLIDMIGANLQVDTSDLMYFYANL